MLIRTGKILAIMICAMFLTPMSVVAEDPLLKKDHPTIYHVKKGDTLWGIASTFLNSPWLWPEIWHVNEQIENPHLIYPGDIIKLVYMEGQPRLTLKRPNNISQVQPDGTLKLSPKARIQTLDSVIPAIPLDSIQSFLVNHRVVEKEELDNAPYVIAGNEGHIVMGSGDYLYARGEFDESATAYGFYRGGDPFVDPETGEILGYEALRLGLGKVLNNESSVAKVRLLTTSEDIRIGDKLLPTIERKVNSIFYPKSPDVDINAYIIHVFGGVRNVSLYNVVVVNKGQRDSLLEGDVLAIYRLGEQVRDKVTNEMIQLPSERSGLLVIFRTFEKVSFGLVIKANTRMLVGDEAKNP